jgi:hypothetical protein
MNGGLESGKVAYFVHVTEKKLKFIVSWNWVSDYHVGRYED